MSALIALAEQIDAARIAANAIDTTAPQQGVYGDLSTALCKILSLIALSGDRAALAYDAILDGCTVTAALQLVA